VSPVGIKEYRQRILKKIRGGLGSANRGEKGYKTMILIIKLSVKK
jgi:hypothetical protein